MQGARFAAYGTRMPSAPSETPSLNQVFLETQCALRRYVRRLVSSREVAEDVVQEAFLRTCEHEGKVRTPRAFLFTIARNLAADVRRQRRLRKTDTLGDFDLSSVGSGEPSPEGRLLADEESRLLKDAIGRLSPQCRVVFTLKVFHDRSYKEIAEQLGLSPRTVENHMARAVRDTYEYLRRRLR